MAFEVPPGDRKVPAGGEDLSGDFGAAAPPMPNCAVPGGDPKPPPPQPPTPPKDLGGEGAPYGEPDIGDELPNGLVAEPPNAPELPRFVGDPLKPRAGEPKPLPTGLDGDEPNEAPPPNPDLRPPPADIPKPPLAELVEGCHPRMSGFAML